MIRAIFFDFYSVWTPDKFSVYLANAQLNGPEVYKQLYDTLEQYYQGQIELDQLAETFGRKLGHPDITTEALRLNEASISPQITDFLRSLHGHFLKIGILGNLGQQEFKLLSDFNDHNNLLEVVASPLSLKTNTPLLHRSVFEAALRSIGESADSCLLVSGNPYFLAFASATGLYTLQFEGLSQLRDTLNRVLASQTPDQPANMV